jgi:hypothetical protein
MRAGYGWFSFRLNEVLKYQIKDRNEIFWVKFYSHVYNIFWLKFKPAGIPRLLRGDSQRFSKPARGSANLKSTICNLQSKILSQLHP